MNKLDSFSEYLTTQSADIALLEFISGLVLTGVLAVILAMLYTRYGTSLSNRKSFARNFESAFERPPDALAAQGFDAANLVLVQLADRRDTRASVRDGMLTVQAYPGVTGILSMRADGNAHKRPFLLEIERGHFVQVE